MITSEKSEEPPHEGGGTNEFFYLDEHGNKQDADMHAAMLDNPEADALCRKRTKQRNLDNGMSQEDADNIFGED